MQTKTIRLWSKNYTLVSAPSIGRFFYQSRCSFFPFFLFRQLCLYISDSLHLFTLFLMDSFEKCQTKSFENEYSTFFNFQILYHKSIFKYLFCCYRHIFCKPYLNGPLHPNSRTWSPSIVIIFESFILYLCLYLNNICSSQRLEILRGSQYETRCRNKNINNQVVAAVVWCE